MDDAEAERAGPPVASPAADGLVRIFDHVPELLAGATPAHAGFLRDHGTVPCVALEPGPWHPPTHPASTRHWLGLLVVEGFVARPLAVGRRRAVELLGPGDLLRPWDRGRWEGAARGRLPWAVLDPAKVAILDQDFAGVVARAPGVTAELLARALLRTTSVVAAIAVADADDVTAGVRRLLANAADRWGVPVTHGMALPPGLTDQVIAYLVRSDVGAVAGALAALEAEGTVTRTADLLVFGG